MRSVVLLLRQNPLFGGGNPNSYTKEYLMRPTRTEMLLAWMTLVKLREDSRLDAADDQFVLSVLQILDREQRKQVED
tara:strand:+ start:912 stop:1142 length:231 start_codon:yes stop_codon:yes gene_type:complete